MKDKKLDIVDLGRDDKHNHLLVDGDDYCIVSYCSGSQLSIYDDLLFEQLLDVRAEELFALFLRIKMTNDMLDGVWLDFELNPYDFYFESEENKPRSSLALRYNPEDWNRTWSIREHFELFRKKVAYLQGAELHCDVNDTDEVTGEPIFNLFNGFGIGFPRNDNSLTVGKIYHDLKIALEGINSEVIDEMHSETSPTVVERFIEFPPEYHHAGIGILSYFGTYLNQQYPNENATVKIEQDGLNVRMLIEPSSGEVEVVV